MPLGGLVRNLIGSLQGEVEIHQFDDRTQARHCRTNRCAADGGFADRGVENALAAEHLHHASGDEERAAVVGDVFAIGDDALVAQHLFNQGFADRVLVGDHAFVIALGDHGGADGRALELWRHGHRLRFGIQVFVQGRRRRVGAECRAHGLFRVAVKGGFVHAVDVGLSADAAINKLLGVSDQRVDVAPSLLFFLAAVGFARIRQRVTVITIGDQLFQHRTGTNACIGDGLLEATTHGQDVHAIDDFSVHGVLRKAPGPGGHVGHIAQLAVRLAGHRVEVVQQSIDHRYAELTTLQAVLELRHGRHLQRFEGDAVRKRTVTDETDSDFAILQITRCIRRPEGDRGAAADDCVGAQVSA